MSDFKKLDDENYHQYIWRLDNLVRSGKYANWKEIVGAVNQELFGDDIEKYRDESAYRKSAKYARDFYEAGVFGFAGEDDYINELKTQRQELEKQRVKVRDERNELKRLIRQEARKESYKDQILRCIAESDCHPLLYDEARRFDCTVVSDSDIVVSLTDLHVGIEIDNFFNKFNDDVLRGRLAKYLDKVFEVQSRHGSKNAYVILSELISGLIHTELRIESNQNVIEQFLTAMDYISQFLSEMSYRFEAVNVYICPGNHSRVMPKKEESLKGENMDHLAIPFLEAKLQNFDNIEFHRNEMEESIAMFNVRGNVVMASHGDKDAPNNVVQKFTMMFGIKPDIVYLGHRHTNGMTTVYDTKVIQSGCMSSSDNYCLDKRLRNKAEQTISVITDDGLDCIYDVKFD